MKSTKLFQDTKFMDVHFKSILASLIHKFFVFWPYNLQFITHNGYVLQCEKCVDI